MISKIFHLKNKIKLVDKVIKATIFNVQKYDINKKKFISLESLK